MSAKDKKTFDIHIVSSVKGGCGKTAFSLFKAMELATKEQEREGARRNATVIWIDADFKGTGSKALLYGKNQDDFELLHKGRELEDIKYDGVKSYELQGSLHFAKKYVPYTLNSYLRDDIHEVEKMIAQGYIYAAGKKGAESAEKGNGSGQKIGYARGYVDFIFSSSKAEDKRIFEYAGGLPMLELGRFTYAMRRLMSKLYRMGQEPAAQIYGYKHLILDMPPGEDAYAAALLEMVYQWAAGQKGVRLYHYLLTTGDRGHVEAMEQELCKMIYRRDSYSMGESEKDKVNLSVVLGEVRQNEFKGEISTEVCRRIHNLDTDKGTIKIYRCRYLEEYCRYCRIISELGNEWRYEITEESTY